MVTYLTLVHLLAQPARINSPVDALHTIEASVSVRNLSSQFCSTLVMTVQMTRSGDGTAAFRSWRKRDVEGARRVFNFSECSDHAGQKPAIATAMRQADPAANSPLVLDPLR